MTSFHGAKFEKETFSFAVFQGDHLGKICFALFLVILEKKAFEVIKFLKFLNVDKITNCATYLKRIPQVENHVTNLRYSFQVSSMLRFNIFEIFDNAFALRAL